MSPELEKLTALVPPLPDTKWRCHDWNKYQVVDGIRFPQSFKDYVHVYGGCNWPGEVIPYVPDDTDYRRIIDQTVRFASLLDVDGNSRDLISYPGKDYLQPILQIGFDRFIWWSTRGEPDDWEVWAMYGPEPRIKILPPGTTIAGLLLSWIEGRSPGVEVLPDIRNLPPDQFVLETW